MSKLFSEVNGISIEKYFLAQRIERVKELLAYGDLTVSEIADKLRYSSVAHLSAQFRAQTGYTIHGYLTGKRLMRARALIAGGTPVLRASEQSGFGDYSAFLRAYRKQFGATPNQEKRTN